MKIQIDSVTVVDDHIDDDGEREIVLRQSGGNDGESVLLNSDNIQQLQYIIERRFDLLTCCTILEQ